MKLSDDTADRLLDLLSTDDDFRAKFQQDPRCALASIGHAPASDAKTVEGAWTCMTVSALASKETIAKSRTELRRMLVSSQVGYQPIALAVRKS